MFAQLPVFQRIGKAAYKANLDNTYAIMKVLENPQHRFKSVHVAGTNGKGSTSHLIASVYQETGFKTGLYTSPHLKDFRERILINGEMISKEKVVGFIEKYAQDFEAIKPSFFEMTVGMAFEYFAEEKVDIAILETGMGGRLDSTNIVIPELAIITNIGFDHMQFLGDSMDKIAGEKAGIIKENIPLIIGETQKSIQYIFEAKAQSLNAPIIFADQEYQIEKQDDQFTISGDLLRFQLQIPLYGDYQQKNILTAFAACRDLAISATFLSILYSQALD